MDYDILFLGGIFPKEYEEKILSDSISNPQFAANALQWKIINGLDANNSSPVQVLNSVYIGSFPFKYKKMLIPTFKFSHNGYSEDINVGFINLLGFKQIFRYHSLKKYIKSWSNQKNDQKKILIAYAMTSVFTKAIKYAKKNNSEIVTVLIVPDLPQYMNTTNKSSFLYEVLKKYDFKVISENLNYVDNYVFLTKYMAEFLKIPNNRFTVIEGIGQLTAGEEKAEDETINQDEKIVLYTGTLNERYGITNLVDSMKYIDDNTIKLLVCGDGDSKDYVINASKNDDRIVYKGILSPNQVLSLQKKATVLVNPRMNNEEYTKYSFPSKILEYLSTGKPTLVYKLDGIPEEYDKHLFYVEGNNPTDLAKAIVEVCSISENERNKIGKEAIEFIKKEKNALTQTKKIFEMIGEEK